MHESTGFIELQQKYIVFRLLWLRRLIGEDVDPLEPSESGRAICGTVHDMKINRLDHVGINVEDLAAAKAFFLALGLEVLGEMEVQGKWVERIIGLKNVRDTIVMMGIPGGEANIELVRFHSPKDAQGVQPSFSNTLGLRHLCLAVDDVDAVVATAKKHGAELIGEIEIYENIYKLCYMRGPEGIILELAEKLE